MSALIRLGSTEFGVIRLLSVYHHHLPSPRTPETLWRPATRPPERGVFPLSRANPARAATACVQFGAGSATFGMVSTMVRRRDDSSTLGTHLLLSFVTLRISPSGDCSANDLGFLPHAAWRFRMVLDLRLSRLGRVPPRMFPSEALAFACCGKYGTSKAPNLGRFGRNWSTSPPNSSCRSWTSCPPPRIANIAKDERAWLGSLNFGATWTDSRTRSDFCRLQCKFIRKLVEPNANLVDAPQIGRLSTPNQSWLNATQT